MALELGCSEECVWIIPPLQEAPCVTRVIRACSTVLLLCCALHSQLAK